SKIKISVVPVADHGVKRIDRLIRHSKRGSSNRYVEERCDYTIGATLRQSLDDGTADLLSVQMLRVPAHDPCQPPSRQNNITLFKGSDDSRTLVMQTARRQTGPRE